MTASPESNSDGRAANVAASPPEEKDVIAFLTDPRSYEPAPERVEVIETHGALVFIAGEQVLKIKRAINYSYMDFSTLEKRRRASDRELAINRPHAPMIYRDVVPITREVDGTLRIGGVGQPVEWAVRMHRFDNGALLSRLAERHGLTDPIIVALAAAIADHHGKAPPATASGIGTDGPTAIIEELAREFGTLADLAPRAVVARFLDRAWAQLARSKDCLDRRANRGFIRRCHGDLHLNNIVLIDGRPTLFDALEFDESLASIDTLYDLAFLLMDLDERGLRAQANLLLNRYLVATHDDFDIEGLVALPLFLALRAGIRAMVGLQRARFVGSEAMQQVTIAQRYLDAALGYLDPAPARLVAVGGFSGTGKSTLARALAPPLGVAPGAVHLRSDLERKRILGVAESERLAPESYTKSASDRVYVHLLAKARNAIEAGHSVIIDAVYSAPDERAAVEDLARLLRVPFNGLWLEADHAILFARIETRRGDASDATIDVAQRQIEHGADALGWTRLDASLEPELVLAAAKRLLGL